MRRYISDGHVFALAVAATTVCVATFGWSAYRHRRRLAAIPIRIHVAGTRGKTSVTRLVWAGLRQADLRVVAKTTGTVPMILLPDGREQPWRRWGAATIAEQWRFVRTAFALKANALVLECMAIEPEFLWASEHFAVAATLVVITNARPDHAEALGDEKDAVAQSLRLVVPRAGTLVVSQEAALPSLLEAAGTVGTKVTVVATNDLAPDQINQALATAVCAELGVPRDIAQIGIDAAGRDIGAVSVTEFLVNQRRLRMINAFACNDVYSFRALWRQHHDPALKPAVLLNARSDRPERTRAFVQALRTMHETMTIVAWDRATCRMARRAGFAAHEIRRLRSRDPKVVLHELATQKTEVEPLEVWGIGNFHGLGERFSRYLTSEAVSC